jgi:hypothetical protein
MSTEQRESLERALALMQEIGARVPTIANPTPSRERWNQIQAAIEAALSE